MTIKSKTDGRIFGRVKVVGTRASDVVGYINANSSFGMKFRIEVVGGNRVKVAISIPRHLHFGEEEKMRISRGEMVFHRIEIRTEVANVAGDYDMLRPFWSL